MASLSPRIVGVVHTAGVLQDALLPGQSWEKMAATLGCKAKAGAAFRLTAGLRGGRKMATRAGDSGVRTLEEWPRLQPGKKVGPGALANQSQCQFCLTGQAPGSVASPPKMAHPQKGLPFAKSNGGWPNPVKREREREKQRREGGTSGLKWPFFMPAACRT